MAAKRALLAMSLAAGLAHESRAGEPEFFELSLEDLMKIPVSVSSRTPQGVREAPGMVTVITEAEIRNSGARNLEDILRLVPGFEFRTMVNNALGLGVRGHVASDGKALLMVDGVEMNERRFGSAVFGTLFPVDQIKRVEIIRGAALANYGGTAELAAINLITKGADDLDGVHLGVGLGATADVSLSRQQYTLMAGKEVDGAKLSALASSGRALRSDHTYTAQNGASFEMADANQIYPSFLNLGVQKAGFSARYIRDDPTLNERDGSGPGIRKENFPNSYFNQALNLDYRQQVSQALTLRPNFLYQQQSPREVRDSSGNLVSGTEVNFARLRLDADYVFNPDLYLSGGVSLASEKYYALARPFPLKPLPFTSNSIASANLQGLWRSNWGNWTMSVRADDYSHAGVVWAERLDWVYLSGPWNFKASADNAKRAPTMENYASNRNAQPETIRSLEIGAGYQFLPQLAGSVNAFNIRTSDTLFIINTQDVGTSGLEAELRWKNQNGYITLNYSYYRSSGTNTRQVQVIDRSDGALVDSQALLGFANQKLTLNAQHQLTPTLGANLSLLWLGERYGYTAPPVSVTDGTLTRFDPVVLANLYLLYRPTQAKNLELGLGVYNLSNGAAQFIQPFNAAHAPLPDMPREWGVRLNYKF